MIVGELLLLLGALFQAGVFPAASWVVAVAPRFGLSPARALLATQPGVWTAFIVVLQLNSGLELAGLSAGLVTPLLVLAALTAWASLSSQSKTGALISLGASATSISFALLLLPKDAGPPAGALLGGSAFMGFMLLLWATGLVLSERVSSANVGLTRAIRVALMFAWAGVPGFMTGSVLMGALLTLGQAIDGAAFVVAWLMMTAAALSLLAPGVVSEKNKSKEDASAQGPLRSAMAGALVLCSFSLLWTGAPFGAFAADLAQAQGPAFSLWLFGPAQAISLGDGSPQLVQMVSWAWAVLVVGLLFANVPEKIVRTQGLRWVAAERGFGVWSGVERAVAALISVTHRANAFLSSRAVKETGEKLRAQVRQLIIGTAQGDTFFRSALDRSLRLVIEVPAKALQLLVGGSVQVYLLFSLGFVLALLLHFWGSLGR